MSIQRGRANFQVLTAVPKRRPVLFLDSSHWLHALRFTDIEAPRNLWIGMT
jgi:hypothetical protein